MVPWRSGYRGGLLSRFPLGAQVRILPASNFFNVHIMLFTSSRFIISPGDLSMVSRVI